MRRGGLGIDVGARLLHCVELDAGGAVVRAEAIAVERFGELIGWAARVGSVAIDAPSGPSTQPHRDDPDPSLAPKFRGARCGEIALGRERGIWVPWPTPEAPTAGWMLAGLRLFAALEAVDPVETYPHAVFRTLAGGRVPSKRGAAGRTARVGLLTAAGVRADGRGVVGAAGDPLEPGAAGPLATWGHDLLDAAASALVALRRAEGRAEAVTCGHDGSAIWLPQPGR